MVYCDNQKCPRTECVRRLQYGPFGVVLRVARYNDKLDKECEQFLLIEKNENSDTVLAQEQDGQMTLF